MEQPDGIRLEQFRQLKKEVRSSDGYLIVGIDVSKDRHHAFFRTAPGRTLLKRLVFENSCWIAHYFSVIFLIILSRSISCHIKLARKGAG
jgi:hypothetical protein